jgi:hypothetical protein
MATYRVHLRSFAPWRRFGTLVQERSFSVPAISVRPPTTLFGPPIAIQSVPVPFGGAFHGDGRRFSLDTGNPSVTSRVNSYLEVNLATGMAGQSKAWCDPSQGPKQGIGLQGSAVGMPQATFTVRRVSGRVNAVIEYGAPNPLVKGAPDIDARGEYSFLASSGSVEIDATVTGDQFPACESFIEDPGGGKLFLGGFAPQNKEQILRLYGALNKPAEVWFQSHLSVKVDARGCFVQIHGGGSGTNSTGPACESLSLTPFIWNNRIMSSIPMPTDVP